MQSRYKKAGLARLFHVAECGLFCFRVVCGNSRCGAIHQLHECHRSVVALTETELEDLHVAAVARCVAWAELIEHFADDIAITGAIKSKATVRERWLLAQRNEWLNNATKLFSLRQRGLDHFIAKQCD